MSDIVISITTSKDNNLIIGYLEFVWKCFYSPNKSFTPANVITKDATNKSAIAKDARNKLPILRKLRSV